MTSTTINTGTDLATLINVFTTTPEIAQPLVDLLVEATERVMRRRPGFVSAAIHVSLDGTRVVNYAQWSSREDFQAMLDDPTAQQHMTAVGDLAPADPRLYQVAAVHHA